ncbi:GntR family transcriptional regulator [Trueperella pyogenes]|uniref:GntR family transcriptional regulator n=1 Tax=Trueperella pyogenes TaxID=1661 RepID=UPI003132CCB0
MEFTEIVVDSESPVPAYYQLYEALRDLLSRFEPGTRLPPERELARTLGVTRTTLRQAFNRLESDQIIFRRQGSGTRVSRPRIVHDARVLKGFTSEYRAQGLEVSSKILSLTAVKTPPHVCFTGIDSTNAIELRRVRYVGVEPMSFEVVWLPASRARGLLEFSPPFSSLYEALAELGIYPTRGTENLSATNLDAYQARLLEQRPGAAALIVDRRTFDADGVSVEQVTSLIRADRFSLQTELKQINKHHEGVHHGK